METRDWLEGFDPIAAGEQAEDGTDLVGIRYNLSLSMAERIQQHRRAVESIQWLYQLRNAPRSSASR